MKAYLLIHFVNFFQKRIATFFCSIFLLLNYTFCQNPSVKQWDKRFGGSGYELITSFHQTSDSGYILGGTSDSPISGDKTEIDRDTLSFQATLDYWIVKIDPIGNKQWDKTFGGTTLG